MFRRSYMFGGFAAMLYRSNTTEGGGGGGGAPTAPPIDPNAPPAAVVAAPWGTADGSYTISDKPWIEALPAGPTRELMAAKAYKNPQQLADAYFGLNKVLSSTPGGIEALTKGDISAFVPKDDATPEQKAEFFKKLGRPESAEKYELKFGEGAQVDEGLVAFGKNVSFDLGLNPKQAQQLADKWQEYATAENTKAAEAARVQNEADVAAITTKWGGEGVLNANVEAGKRVVGALKLDAATMEKLEGAMGAAPMLDLFAKLGSMSKEGGFTTGTTGNSGGGADPATMSPEQAKGEIARLQADSGFMEKYTNASNPEHRAALLRMENLFKRAG